MVQLPDADMNGHGQAQGQKQNVKIVEPRKPSRSDSTDSDISDAVSTLSVAGEPANGKNGLGARSAFHKRKQSSPMAPPFMVSAPGKVIVFGEHAVVHGKAAMAASISLRSYLLVTTLSKSHRQVHLVFPDIGLDHTWNIEDLPWHVFAKHQRKPKYYDLVTSLDEDLLKAMEPHLKDISLDAAESDRKVHVKAASAFLYLFLCLSHDTSSGFVYTLRSTIPVGAGLGSSASISVCLASALLKQIHVLSGPHEDQPPEEIEVQLERINRWAFVGEMCIHGNPSGVDNTIATKGKAALFKRTDYTKPPTVLPLTDFPELPLLLVNTNQTRSTATEVAKVSNLMKKYPDVTETTLNSIESVTMSAYKLITSPEFKPNSEKNLEHLGDLFRMNHGFLVSLGVSHPKLEHIRNMVDYEGIGWTKLTGAGGGGCAITLLKNDVDDDAIKRLSQEFKDIGFSEYRSTLGGDGVGILYPAVLHNGTEEEGGEEINQKKFLTAENDTALEQLVGVGTMQKRPEWKFWRL